MAWWWLGVVVVVVLGLAAEVRRFLWNGARAAELGAAADFAALVAHHEALLRSLRPLDLIYRHLMAPGMQELQFALHLHMMGWNDRALPLCDTAVLRSAHKPLLHGSALAVRALVRAGLGQGVAAEADYQALCALPQVPAALRSCGAQLALLQGNFPEAVRRAEAVLAVEPNEETARLCLAEALTELGRYDQAVRATEFAPRSFSELAGASAVRQLERDDAGSQILAAHERERAQVVLPAPLLVAALAWLEAGDVRAGQVYLARAEPVLGRNPVMVFNFHLLKAMLASLAGDPDAAQASLRLAQAQLSLLPHHEGLHRDLQVGRARVALDAGRPADALSALEPVLAHPEHVPPVTLGIAWYWRARALAAAGDQAGAREAWRALLKSGMSGRKQEAAEQALQAAPA